MKELLIVFFVLTGSVFMLISAVGLLRMPDLFTRMHAATKVGTVGIVGIVTAAAIHFGEMRVAAPAVLIIVFFLATAPVAAHMIGRAAYLFGVPLWKKTVIDEWRGTTKISVAESPGDATESPP